MDSLCSNMLSDNEQLRDISSIGESPWGCRAVQQAAKESMHKLHIVQSCIGVLNMGS